MTKQEYIGWLDQLSVSEEKQEEWIRRLKEEGGKETAERRQRAPGCRWIRTAVCCLAAAVLVLGAVKAGDGKPDGAGDGPQSDTVTVIPEEKEVSRQQLESLLEETGPQEMGMEIRRIQAGGKILEYEVKEMEGDKKEEAGQLKGELLTSYQGPEETGRAYRISGRTGLAYLFLEEGGHNYLGRFFEMPETGTFTVGEMLELVYQVRGPEEMHQVIFRKTNVDNTERGQSIQVPEVSLTEEEKEQFFRMVEKLVSLSPEQQENREIHSAWDVYGETGEVAKVLRFVDIITAEGDLIRFTYDPVQAALYQGGYQFFSEMTEEENKWMTETAQIDLSAGTVQWKAPEDGAEPVTGKEAEENPAGSFRNISELYQYWTDHGYPDYVGDVYSKDGGTENLVVSLTGTEEERKAARKEILDLLQNRKSVSFQRAAYSRNDLCTVLDEIIQEMSEQSAAGTVQIYGAGLGWTSVNGTVTGFGESKKESRVVVTVDASVYEEYEKRYRERYGDRVYVQAEEEAPHHDLAVME